MVGMIVRHKNRFYFARVNTYASERVLGALGAHAHVNQNTARGGAYVCAVSAA
jgi:hypothetical protein